MVKAIKQGAHTFAHTLSQFLLNFIFFNCFFVFALEVLVLPPPIGLNTCHGFY